MFDTKVLHRLGLLLLLGMAGASCVDEKVVFRDRELFEEPPVGAANFLGYTNQETKLTVCGNCHVGAQAEWEDTQHSDAWLSLEGSGHAAAQCEGCHTVSDKGNAATSQVAWDATRDTRYHDVQCESCHGAGQTHVENPQSTNLPLAAMSVGVNAETGCGECHSGTHHPFVEEWAASRHGIPNEHAAERAECAVCHEAKAIFEAWGINSNFIERDNPDVHMSITCSVCHDPHARDNAAQLRFPIDVPIEETNLCMRCHHKRGVPDPTSSRGPHSPEGPLLLGEAGWFPPNFSLPPGAVVATHGSERNPRLCAGCHVNSFEVTDPATGAFVFNATGHLFAATPCLDAQGIPTTQDCAITERSFQSCDAIGCHTANSARSAQIAAESRIELLAGTLQAMINQIPASEFSTSDNRYSTGEGAKFNAELALAPGSMIHNPFLIEALITSSIKQITIDYGISSPPGVSLENELQKNATTN